MATAFLLTVLAMPVCGAILGAIAVIGVDHLTSDDPVPDVLIGALVVGTLAALVLWIAGANSWRAYRGEAGRGPWAWLAYAVPVTVAFFWPSRRSGPPAPTPVPSTSTAAPV